MVPVNDDKFKNDGNHLLVIYWKKEVFSKGFSSGEDETDEQDHVDTKQFSAVDLSKVKDPQSAKEQPKLLSIYDCLDKFGEREKLADTETIYCSQCKQHLAPIKKMDLYTTPDYLILQLKRFQYVPGYHFVRREKINDVVDFPIEGLDLRNYVKREATSSSTVKDEPSPIYDLYAVSQHIGGLGGGHYTAVVQNFQDKKWYEL